MPRPKLHKREETLEKALSFFWRNGFAGSSTRELGQALDMHPGSLYSSFGSKENLCLEAIELYGQQSSQQFSDCMDGKTFFDGLTQYLGRAVSDTDHPCTCFLVKTFSSRLTGDQKLVEKSRELVTGFRAHLADKISAAQEAGEVKAGVDCQALASLVQTQIMGLRCLADSGAEQTVLENAVRDVVQALRGSAER